MQLQALWRPPERGCRPCDTTVTHLGICGSIYSLFSSGYTLSIRL